MKTDYKLKPVYLKPVYGKEVTRLNKEMINECAKINGCSVVMVPVSMMPEAPYEIYEYAQSKGIRLVIE